MAKRATELEWLRWFHSSADFGPGDCDVRQDIIDQFRKKTGKLLPKGYEESDYYDPDNPEGYKPDPEDDE